MDNVHFYPKSSLQLKEDAPGAKMWGIALEKTELTFFEVEPNSRFEWHRHESEQITMVLEGALFFEVEQTIYKVEAGDVIAIPSNVLHAAYTEDKAVKAIDAWSPVLRNYPLNTE